MPNIDDPYYFSLHTDEHAAELLSGGLGVNLFPGMTALFFALSPPIISQGLREFKCDLLGSDESLSLRYLSNELLYTSHLTTLILNLERETLSLTGKPDFEKEGATSTLKLAF